MKEMGVGVELNFASNLKLGNIERHGDYDVKNAIYLLQKYQIPIFLGTDGYGVYQSTPEQQFELAKEFGINTDKIAGYEDEYIQNIQERTSDFVPLPKNFAKGRIRDKLRFLFHEKDNGKSEHIFENQGVSKLRRGTTLKMPIIVAGGSLKTRSDGNFEEYKNMALTMQVLVDVIKPTACYFITGGTNCGPERLLHSAIENRNSRRSNPKMRCIGAIPSYLGKTDNENALTDFAKIKKRNDYRRNYS